MELLTYGSLFLIVFFVSKDLGIPVLRYFGIVGGKKLDDVHIAGLDKYSPYYRKLGAKHKTEFRKRVAVFMASKDFIPRNMGSVTEEMKMVVASFAIQLTFGLPEVYLAHFQKILMYPTDYYSTINNAYHKGEVNPRFGIIVLSWKNLVQGIADESDGINLGLHELAHAIHLENRISNEEFDFLDRTLWAQYSELAAHEMVKIKEGRSSIFRARAAQDQHEFFAVLMENFFERPQALKAYNPILYKTTTLLLQQDPIRLLN